MSDYWKASIARSLYDEIIALFNKSSQIKARYNDNPVEFLREAIRDKIKAEEQHIKLLMVENEEVA